MVDIIRVSSHNNEVKVLLLRLYHGKVLNGFQVYQIITYLNTLRLW